MSHRARAMMCLLRTLSLRVGMVASLVACPLEGQLTLQVVAPSGQPIPAVTVFVMGTGVVLEERSTDALGVVELSGERWSEARRLSLNHLGFQTLILQVDEIPADGVVHLAPVAVGIEGLDVLGRSLCPIDADPAARRLWQAVAALYAGDTGSRALSARFRRVGGRDLELTRIPETAGAGIVLGRGAGMFNSEGRRVPTIEDQIERTGYAWAPFLIGGVGGVWEYPGLEFLDAYHFATPRFGAEHEFAVLRETEEEVQLAFCPAREGDRPTLQGTLTLRPGEALLSADFQFRTREPDMGAGGRVVFLAHRQPRDARPHLMAARGEFYRHDGVEQPFPDLPRSYSRRFAISTGWFVHPAAAHPCKQGGEGFTVHGDPPDDDEGGVFDTCIAAHLAARSR